MEEKNKLSEAEELLIDRTYKIWNEYEFMFGISYMCQGEDAAKAMLKYMDEHPNTSSDEITEYAVDICDKYNSHLNA